MSFYMDMLVSARDSVPSTQASSSCFINNLPIEILAKIFLYTVQLYLRSKPKQKRGNLASVCKKWREVTDTFGELWSHIYLGHSTTPDILKSHLIRSAGLPIFIQLAEGAGEDHWEKTDPALREDISRGGMTSPNSLFNLLYQECHRWKAVYVEENQTANMLRLITQQSDHLHLLQSIEIDISFVDSLPDFHRDIRYKATGEPRFVRQEPEDVWPNLRSVTISTPPFHLPVVERYFVRSSITDFTLDIVNESKKGLPNRGEFRVWHWLRDMPLLQSLRLFFTRGLNNYHARIQKRELARHDHLRRIYLMGSSSMLKLVLPIVDCASAQLEHLGIKIANVNVFDRLELIEFTLPPLPHLKSLSIETASEEKETLMVFSALPKLQKLIIDHGRMISVDDRGTWRIHQEFSQKPEEMLVHVLERALENATKLPVGDGSSETGYLRDLQLKSVYLSAKEEELITALAAKVR
jgi:hypothetical protein